MTSTTSTSKSTPSPEPRPVDAVTIRFCGDSGDGMQLTGERFTNTSAVFGNDVACIQRERYFRQP